MKNILIAAVLAFTSVVAVDSSVAQKADDAIKQTFVQIDRCTSNNDATCVGELMVDDATYLAPTLGGIVKGKAQIVKAIEKLIGGPATAAEKRPKQTHVVESVRMIGEDHAFVDASVETAGKAPGAGGTLTQEYHFAAVMTLKGSKWLFEDVRSYVVQEPTPPAKKDAPQSSGKESPAPAKN
jgi:uncharacterized protein (TIGR02246 family)